LRNLIERAVIVAVQGEIQLRHLPGTAMSTAAGVPAATARPAAVAASPEALPQDILQVKVGMRMADVEEAFVRLTLKHTNNNKRKSAQLLGLCLRTLHNKLRAWDGGGKKNAIAAGVSRPPE